MMGSSSKDAFWLVLKIAVLVFVSESLVMLVLDRLPSLTGFSQAIVDSTLLTTLLAPIFYSVLYRPIRREIVARGIAERDAVAALDEARLLNKSLLQAQEQLLSSEKMVAMGHLAAGVAHEINNPVGFVGSNLFTLRDYTGKLLHLLDAYEAEPAALAANPAARIAVKSARQGLDLCELRTDIEELLRESSDGVERIKRIARDLKDFSRADDDVWECADINAELERTLNVVHNELKYHVQLVKHFGNLPAVRCVAPQINQVFLNLLVNASQAIEGKGTITLSTAVAQEHVVVSISDTGCGMTPAQQAKAFEAFYTTKPRGQGTGLGLSVSSGIVEKHHGRIEVQSTPGEGTTFHVYLPISQSEVPAPVDVAGP